MALCGTAPAVGGALHIVIIMARLVGYLLDFATVTAPFPVPPPAFCFPAWALVRH